MEKSKKTNRNLKISARSGETNDVSANNVSAFSSPLPWHWLHVKQMVNVSGSKSIRRA